MADLDQALAQLAARRAQDDQYLAYYRGEHNLAFASDKFKNAFGALLQAFADNLCPTVLDAVVDRLVITGFAPDGPDSGADSRVPALPAPDAAPAVEPADLQTDIAQDRRQRPADVGDLAWDVWRANRMPRRAGEVHLEATRQGDAFVIVWPDPATGLPALDPQPTGTCTVGYDPDQRGRLLWGAKIWQAADRTVRATLYYADRLEKYTTDRPVDALPRDSRAFVPYRVPGEAWPLPNPWARVPVFHFACNAPVGAWGRSDLADVLPLQDALNKAVCDMLVGMEFNAFPQRWVTGLEVELDELTQRPIAPFVPGEDRIWAVGDKEVKFGEFPAAGLENYLKVQDSLRYEIARVTRIPLHYLALTTGQRAPSGEALRIAEAPLAAKIADRAAAFGEAWGDALSLALAQLGLRATVTPAWQDPSPKSQLELARELQILATLGVPREALWKAWGYTDTEIAAMAAVIAARTPPALVSGNGTAPPGRTPGPDAAPEGMMG